MPLHAKHKRMARIFDPFDQPILGGRIDDQAFADFLYGLMVRGVDLQRPPPQDFFQASAARDDDFMAADFFFGPLFMLIGVRRLGGDVLIERAAEDDVDRLRAAADAEQRQVLLERQLRHLQFELGALLFDRADLLDRLFVVVTRVDIEVAAADQQAVEPADEPAQ